ncbi:MAG: hypothetical protein AAGN35_23085 [Bacteroidota bacterium]
MKKDVIRRGNRLLLDVFIAAAFEPWPIIDRPIPKEKTAIAPAKQLRDDPDS